MRGRWADIDRIRVLGSRFRFHDQVGDACPLPEFYDRQVQAFGEDAQRLLQALHVGVVGAGGTSGMNKAEVARAHLAAIGLGTKVSAIPAFIDAR